MCCLFLFSGCSSDAAIDDSKVSEKDIIQCISDHEPLSADLITNLTYETCADGEHHKYNVCFDYEGCNYTCIYDIDSKNVSEFHHLDDENGTHHSSTHHNETEHSSTHHSETHD